MLSREWLQTLISITNYQYAPSNSAEAIANNQDLLAEILVRLPVKSLVRFKSVSKGWYSFISDPRLSCRLLPDTVSGLFLCKTSRGKLEYEFVPLTHHKPPFKSLTFDDNPSGLRILQSCNGLLCCSSDYAYSNKQDYYIYNPTTKQYFKLPQLAIEDTIKIYGVGLAFDPAKSCHYKVVFVRQANFSDHDKNCYQIEVYSSQTRSWSLSGSQFVAPNGTDFKAGVFCNGAIHWPFRLYFNVDEEKLGEIATMPPIPEEWQERTLPIYFGASRNNLQLIEIYGPLTTQFNIYELQNDYSSWFVKYHVDLEAISAAFPGMMIRNPSGYVFSILSVVREAVDEESYLVLHIPGMAIHYNLKYGIFRKICDFASNDNYPIHNYPRYYWDDASPFIPTLSPV
ncbi:hypothetical protein COLO4_37351 [Corchorus olitorius]|uniref:F-box domain-containing protein n=1 Tax=Corchorus olitorius TaxID=93759 RepID=A0A1R3G289_9ROSI|nr:hypothetical protein COLO4_37351 [Corchorus olitorius]